MSGGVSHVVVDGSNIATESRSTPSLAQLESAVTELRREMPDAEVIVVVDATFAHRIAEDERKRFELAALRGDYAYPPAGAIGRGDAFLLRIAQKIDATVLSNDSFQEFHGEHDWLFERGRLLGGTPVPGVGWIFVPRTPVRGPKSRIAVRDAERSKNKIEKAIAAATREAVEPDAHKSQRKGKKKGEAAAGDGKAARQPQAVNDPLTFISFVAEHPLGVSLEGEVESFTSHGAVVRVGDMHCYVPLSGLGDPPPRSAREVLHKDERREFVLTALDPQRRGVELALPGVAVVSGRPSEETVEAELAMTQGRRKRRAPAEPVPPPEAVAVPPPLETPGVEAPPAAKAPRSRKKAVAPPPAPVLPAAAAEPPAKPQRSRRAAATPAAEPTQAETITTTAQAEPMPAMRAPRTRKRAAPPAEPATPARAPRSRARAAASAEHVSAEAPPAAKAVRARKKAAPPVESPAAAKVPATGKKAAGPPAAAKAPRARKKAAPASEPATATRSRARA